MDAIMATLGGLGGDRTPNAVNWANIGPGTSPQANADQTISGIETGITLRAMLSAGTYGSGPKSLVVYKNSVESGLVTAADAATLDLAVVNGDTVHYEGTKESGTHWDATVTVTVLETGQTLDTFTVSVDAAP